MGDSLSILGGGQLGRMTLQAASRLGIDVVIAERFPDSPAARMTSQSHRVPPQLGRSTQALDHFSPACATIVTLENEFVDWRVLATRSRQQRCPLCCPRRPAWASSRTS